MKNSSIVYTLMSVVILFGSCKKEEESAASSPSYATNMPTSSSYFEGALSDENGTSSLPSWTIDGKSYMSFTNQFNYVYKTKVSNGVLMVASIDGVLDNHLSFAPISDLKNFSGVMSLKSFGDFTMLNDLLICTAYEGTHQYTGFWDTKSEGGEISLEELPTDHTINNLKTLGNNVIGHGYAGGGSLMAYTVNGATWHFTNEPINGVGAYDYFDGKTWAFSSNQWAHTTGSDLGSATWTIDQFDFLESNSSDTNGTFYAAEHVRYVNDEFRIYGSIYANSDGTHYPCVNISKDQGQTWKTHFLTGIGSYTNNTNMSGRIYPSKSLTIIDEYFGGGTIAAGIYSSENGIDFELWTDQARIDEFTRFQDIKEVRN